MELITAVNSNLKNKNSILYCLHGKWVVYHGGIPGNQSESSISPMWPVWTNQRAGNFWREKKDTNYHRRTGNGVLWETLRDGYPRQKTRARELHQVAGVPEGPCGLPELATFQQYLSTLDPPYQLKVLSRQHPFFLIFRGPDAPHTIVLLKSEHHYEGCTTITGFVNKSYWCPECDRGFDHKDAANHPCEGTTCRSCHRNQPRPCPDYDRFAKPTLVCNKCYLSFYGPNCLAFHRSSKTCGKIVKFSDWSKRVTWAKCCSLIGYPVYRRGILLKCCFSGHSTNVRRTIPLKWASPSFPNRRRTHMKRKMGRIFDPLWTASLTMTNLSLGMLLLKS